jgi:hypothetical protein
MRVLENVSAKAKQTMRLLELDGSPSRAFWVTFATLLAARMLFAACSLQYHIDGDNTVSLLQGIDWNSTPQREYYWGQNYMGTTEVWLFSSLWRLFTAKSTIPLLYWIFCAQLLFTLGVALILSGLVFTDAAFWTRPRVYIIAWWVFGFAAPAFQKYAFGVGHGYSAGPLYAGISIACYLFRDRLRILPFLLAGFLLGESHYIFRLHVVYSVALVAALIWAGPRTYGKKIVVLLVGVALGMLPEKLMVTPQGYEPSTCVPALDLALANGQFALTQSAIHVGTLPYSLLESEHALWFASHRPFAENCIWWGERIGAALLLVLLAIDLRRSFRSPKYRIFTAILLVNSAVLMASCLVLDIYSGRRYMFPALFSFAFLMLSPPWTFIHRFSIGLRLTAFAVYAVSAVSFTTPLAQFAKQSMPLHFSQRRDCVAGGGGDLTAIMALNHLRLQTIDFEWRLRANYSRNVAASPEDVSEHCRQVFWVDTRGRPKDAHRDLFECDDAYYTASPRGIVEYPQQVRFYRCDVVRR